jgi:hypothetical protein
MKPKAHATRWTLVVTGKRPLGRLRARKRKVERVYDYETQAEAEAELAKAQERSDKAYILPPVKAWGGKL